MKPPPNRPCAEFMAKLHRIIDLHPMSNGSVDDTAPPETWRSTGCGGIRATD
jgi:hypothetical protein